MTPDQAANLRATYLQVAMSWGTTPTEVASELDIPVRYARELLGVLTNAGLVVINDTPDGDQWQDAQTEDEDPEQVIDRFLADHTEEEDEMPTAAQKQAMAKPSAKKATAKSATKTATKKATAPAKDTNPADLPICLCGCGQPVTSRKSKYLPGHDARHAGNVGRQLIEEGAAVPELLAALGSDKLRAKAVRMLEVHSEKQEAKAKKAEAKDADK